MVLYCITHTFKAPGGFTSRYRDHLKCSIILGHTPSTGRACEGAEIMSQEQQHFLKINFWLLPTTTLHDFYLSISQQANTGVTH